MKVVYDEARLVQRLSLTDVVHKLITSLLLDELNNRV